MKLEALQSFVTKNEIIKYVGTLWRTPEFKASHSQRGGYVRNLVEKFAEVPRFFFEMSNPDIENSHFSSWWNAISLRNYENDAISDVYYLHEIWHAATMTYNENSTFADWFKKMGLNELEASVQSEVLVYFELPTLREKSFNHEIWADRFLESSDYYDIHKERVKVMTSPNPYDFLELQIANYGRQNLDWCIMWKDARKDVEQHMREFVKLSATDRKGAARKHLIWLATRAMNTTENKISKSGQSLELFINMTLGGTIQAVPFEKLAKNFAELAAENKKKYGNHLLT